MSGENASNDPESLMNTLRQRLAEGVKDIASVSIVTAQLNEDERTITLNPDGSISKATQGPEGTWDAKILATTNIGIDGDFTAVIPTKNMYDGATRQEIMIIHNANVQTAVINWNNFLEGIAKMVRIAFDLGKSLPNPPNGPSKVKEAPPISSSPEPQVVSVSK